MSYTVYADPFTLIKTGNTIQGRTPIATNVTPTKEQFLFGIGYGGGQITIDQAKRDAFLTQIKTNLRQRVDQILLAKKSIYQGTVTFQSQQWNSSLSSLENLKVELEALADDNTLTPTPWLNAAGAEVVLTEAQLKNLRKAINKDLRTVGKSLYDVAKAKKTAINALTVDNFETFDLMAGWPF